MKSFYTFKWDYNSITLDLNQIEGYGNERCSNRFTTVWMKSGKVHTMPSGVFQAVLGISGIPVYQLEDFNGEHQA